MVGDKYELISRVAGSFDSGATVTDPAEMLAGEGSSATFSITSVATTNILIINLYPFTQLLYILKSNY